MLQDSIIEESTSRLWLSQACWQQALHGFWKLNQIMEFNSNLLPRVHDLIKHLGRAYFISALDLTKAY